MQVSGVYLADKFLVLELKVVPSAGRQAWELEATGRLKVYLKSAPENNKANLELIKLLAKQLKLTQNQIQIVSGATGRSKKICIEQNWSRELLLQKLGLVQQQAIFSAINKK